MAKENQPFEDVSPIKHGEFPFFDVYFRGGIGLSIAILSWCFYNLQVSKPFAHFLSSNVHRENNEKSDGGNGNRSSHWEEQFFVRSPGKPRKVPFF